ncbi:sensor histidine kinase [Streptomyces botrytidirepellens]|uniref:histidine kinase n=1 Tax=Streptomyces botrytidirepellens TaxID=2486417 RepID=A0A3M8VMP6_9ACTN|nr:ATP-binding protein [Streptomyces botrytidirepellens]RNG17979.1 histidine kinase [Streptomyces botrytidirepellens]
MITEFRARSRLRRIQLCVVGAVSVVLVALEGLNAPYPLVALATTVSGTLCLAALAVPHRLFIRCTLLATAVSCALTLVETGLPRRPENTPGLVELSVLLWLITRAVRRCSPLPATLLPAAPAFAAVLLPLRIAERGENLGSVVGMIVACVPFMVVLGLCLRLYDALRAREREALLQAQRLEHARELHDFVAHHVTAIVAQTKAARFTAAAGHTQSPEDLDQMLAHIERAGSQALGSMRAMVSSLRDPSAPAATSPTGGLAGLRALTRDFSAAGPSAELTLDPRLIDRPLPPEITTAVHRVVQESLTNVRKHAAGAGRVEVRVTLCPGDPEQLEVSVADDGRGAAPAARAEAGGAGTGAGWNGGGYGLVGLTERIERAGGRFTTGPRDGGGWHVLAVLPLDAS